MFKSKALIYPIIILICFSVAGIIFYQYQNQDEVEGQKTLKFAYRNRAGHTSFILFMAKEAGFFSEQGFNVELEHLKPAISVQALLADELDYLPFTKEGTLASRKGMGVKTIMLFSEHPGYYLIARPDIEIKDIKNIGIGARFSPLHYEALKIIDEHNLSAEILSTSDALTRRTMLISGRIDAIIDTLPTAFQLRDEEGLNILTESGEQMAMGLVTSDKKIQNNPEEVEKVISAILSTIEFLKTRPDEAKELLFKFYGFEKNDANQKIIDDTYNITKEILADDGLPKGEGINNTIQIAKAGSFETFGDIQRQEVTQEDIDISFDFRFLK